MAEKPQRAGKVRVGLTAAKLVAAVAAVVMLLQGDGPCAESLRQLLAKFAL